MTEDTSTEKAQFVSSDRLATVELKWPLTYDGKLYDRIVLKRLTVREVSEWARTLLPKAGAAPDAEFVLPICFDSEGARIPSAVMDALDDDDGFEIERRILDFLPRRYRADSGSTPPIGRPIEASSDTSQAGA